MKMCFCFICLIVIYASSYSQILDETKQKQLTTIFKKYIPAQHLVIDSASADFDKDGLMDIVLVTGNTNQIGNSQSVTVLKKTSNGYQVAVTCADAVLCADCGGIFGDPYAGVSFKKNVLVIYHYGGSAWRWTSNFTFRFQNNSWDLIGISSDSYWNLGECNGEAGVAGRNLGEANFSTKKMHVTETKDTDCIPKKDVWKKIKAYKKVSLQNFNVQENYFKLITTI